MELQCMVKCDSKFTTDKASPIIDDNCIQNAKANKSCS